MTADHTDFYAVLGVPPDASQGEITRAYRHLVWIYHPDTQAEPDSRRLAAVTAAYEVLRNPARRHAYDRQRRPPTTGPARPDRVPGYHQSDVRAGPVRWHPTP